MALEETVVEDDKEFINEDIQSKKKVFFGVLTLLGLLNNLGYVLVNSSAQTLGKHFGEENLMSLFTFCLVALSIATSFCNSKYLLKVRHFTKIKIMLSIYTVAYLCVGISNMATARWGFFLCLFGSTIMGIATTLGEQTNLGFLKGFAPDLISGWGCGTGFAGVFGAGINFALRFVNVPGYLIFLGMIPTNLVYLAGFMWLKNQKVHQVEVIEHRYSDVHPSSQGVLMDEPYANTEDKDKGEADINQKLSVENFNRVWPIIWGLALNLASVYFLEYTIITAFADKATDDPNWQKDDAPGMKKNAFILLNLCYQIGVVISRSSLACIKIRKVWIVTALQLINFFLWSWIGYVKPLGLAPLFILMIWVGLMGGASYVNVLYLILESRDLEKKDKEVSINIVSMFNNIGVILTTLLSLGLENTIYKDK